MINFKNINVNPKNRKTGDCSTRALCAVLNISYEDALKLQFEESLKCYYDPTSKQVIEKILEKFGYVKMKQPRKASGKKYLVCEIDQITTKEERDAGILITVANHHTCVIGDSIIDLWDCSKKAIGNWYKKVGKEKVEINHSNLHELFNSVKPENKYRII